ncbi:hypothetical protein P170DRAFT_435749 [Aspergillus steynii IBT 23096]|uniref:Cyclin-D1-binding protein 1-like N-terminal domain-containing protein n=1 Tax=Aspergillus steynii IBT 23096 TaxID=1392250 RepID=A0A2I2GCH0_9EURO|nr:uncharacterized protein P170DRAFT_435749 [Aspergillus steynii IBT 23096]PLB50555.1 hypothetical protein P170DRAFT_435749 [Aspergillus steynii IBT 23096]
MSQKFRITLDTTITLVQQFQLALATPVAQGSGQVSGKEALPLLSASSTALKSQVTKLSLLTITSPFTHSAVTSVLSEINESVLPSLVTAALLVTPIDHTQAFQTEVLVLTKSTVRELASLLKEVQSVADRKDETTDSPKRTQELSQQEKDVVTVAAGRVWEACDVLVDFAAKGVIGFVIRRVEEWRDLVRDAVEEIEEWDPDEEGDDFFDDLLSDGGQSSTGKNGDEDDEGDDDGESSAVLHENKKNAIRILKPVAQIYPAIVTNRLKTAPELSPPLVSQLENLMLNLRSIPENVDEVAGALYEANFTKSNHYLGAIKEHAVKAIKTVALPWTSPESPSPAQESEDKFATWSKTWLKVVGEVSKTIVSEDAKGGN